MTIVVTMANTIKIMLEDSTFVLEKLSIISFLFMQLM